jgi:hypothetical protein
MRHDGRHRHTLVVRREVRPVLNCRNWWPWPNLNLRVAYFGQYLLSEQDWRAILQIVGADNIEACSGMKRENSSAVRFRNA